MVPYIESRVYGALYIRVYIQGPIYDGLNMGAYRQGAMTRALYTGRYIWRYISMCYASTGARATCFATLLLWCTHGGPIECCFTDGESFPHRKPATFRLHMGIYRYMGKSSVLVSYPRGSLGEV